MTSTRERIPHHLRALVVEQDYGAYDEIDQAVWRFILLQTYARLSETAHPAYANGLPETGISVERIPRVEEMDECLGEYGWGAVAVDGFIPPRAFQEFQALGIMTIAADIRSSDHLSYTPAPDIVHESAGHAPIVPDAQYREYLQRFGEVGARTFSSPADRRIDRAIHHLSALKELAASTPAQIADAERDLADAQEEMGELSEAALLSRLHWWTVEYGLVGTAQRYQLYGAGLLSSLGESHFCHAEEVVKLPLTADCIDVGYDITRPQPQLFVAQDFEHLQAVLAEVAAGLAQCRGGEVALERALASEEVATLELSTGLQITGVLTQVRGGTRSPAYLQLTGPCALSRAGATLPGHTRAAHPEGYGTPLGRLHDGRALAELSERDLRSFAVGDDARELAIRFASGVEVIGRLVDQLVDRNGRLLVISFDRCRVEHRGDLLFEPAWGRYDLAVGEEVTTAFAGPADPAYWPAADFSGKRRPRASERAGEDARILDLYREALRLWERPDSLDLVTRFELIAESLCENFPDRWLLRWNLLECLRKQDRGAELAVRLREELLAIEKVRPSELPITLGLRYLDERYSF